MESSSESAASNDSFLWVDTSNDSSDDSTSIQNHNKSMAVAEKDEVKSKGKHSKKSSTGNEPNQNGLEHALKKEKHNVDYKRPKTEIDEDVNHTDLPVKKLRRSHHTSHTDDDSYLNLKVKQEDTSALGSSSVFRNTNNSKKNGVVDETLYSGEQESVDESISKSKKKKKKKSKIKYNSDNEPDDNSGNIKLEENEALIKRKVAQSFSDVDLDIKVEQENNSFTTPNELKHKSRKKKHSETKSSRTYSEGNDEVASLEVQEPSETVNSMHKKNKKKSNRSKKEDNDEDNLMEDKFTAEETIVGFSRHQNETLEEASGDDSYNEISAIKGDDDHHLQTTLFSNKSMENDASDDEASIKDVSTVGKPQRRISERLVFEDDDASMKSVDATSSSLNLSSANTIESKSVKLSNYLRKNPNMETISQSLSQDAVITKDDNLWVVKCPTDIDLDDLSGCDLKLDGLSKIKMNGLTYESSITEDKDARITVLSMEHSKYKLKNLPLQGVITIRKRIPKLHISNDSIMINNQTNFIPLPETKCRHPLLGVHYKKALKLVERLNAAQVDNPVTFKKKRKHQESIDRKDIEQETTAEVILKSETDPPRKRKKKQREVEEEAPVPKKKRKKHNPETAEAWESEKAIEENLFNF